MIKIHFYKEVLKTSFPNLQFKKLRVDTCKTCDSLNMCIKANKDNVFDKKAELLEHHKKANMARTNMNVDITTVDGNTSCLIIDLQQVIPLPTLTHSEMFYLRQLSHFNFCIHAYPSNQGFMNLWHEGEGGRGASEIASCIFNLVNNVENFQCRENLVIWSDNCCGQNKNKYVLFLYMYITCIWCTLAL